MKNKQKPMNLLDVLKVSRKALDTYGIVMKPWRRYQDIINFKK